MKWLEKLPLVPAIAAMFGLVAAILTMATPGWLFERAVVASGLPSLLSAAQPPLGDTARLLAAIVCGILVAVSLWAAGTAIERLAGRPRSHRPAKARGVRIDPEIAFPSHRSPIFAGRDLGAPFMSDEAMEVAKNELILDTPLDDAALAEEPQEGQQVDDGFALSPENGPAKAGVEELEAFTQHDADGHMAPSAASLPEPVAVESAAPPAFIRPVEIGSVSGLMARLEAALNRRQARGIAGSPIPLGDLALLRRALGTSR